MNKDEEIKKKVKELLFNKMENADQGINAEVEKGIVTLYGIVDILSEKNYVEKIIQRIDGIKEIKNDLTISTDGTVEDKAVTTTLNEQIQSHPDLKDNNISAETKKGIVYLNGQVKSLNEENTAKNLASTIIGVKEIVSLIKIKADPKKPSDDATLVNAVEVAFSAAQDVSAHDITTNCSNGVIYLDGTAKSQEEKKAASHYASTVSGVKKVVNHLTISDKKQLNKNAHTTK